MTPLTPEILIVENKMKNQTIIFAYGTLKQGQPNNPLMQNLIVNNAAIYIGTCTTLNKFPLVLGPYGVPFLINLPETTAGHNISGELYAVTDSGLAELDELEGVEIGHYERLPIDVVGGHDGTVVEAYFAHRNFGEEMWRKNCELGFGSIGSAYTSEEAELYVKRGDRPHGEGKSFLEAIRSFVS